MTTPKEPKSWIEHACISFLATVVVAVLGVSWGVPFGVGACGASLGAFCGFVIREEMNERTHKAAGTWRSPDLNSVTPLVDKYGDLIGPTMNVVIWWTAVAFLGFG
jgi:hypothetical protein